MTQLEGIALRLMRWQRAHGRNDLPWQHTSDPYRVWLSEIMLQQTQVATVIPYYARFLNRFATLEALAAAPAGDVMTLWSGLGYYARARNLLACARAIVASHGGRFPESPQALAALPGIGPSTANAIAAACFGVRAPILDGNVKRVLCRHFEVAGLPGTAATDAALWALVHAHMPARDVARYNQALMDLGATVCTRQRPQCAACPLATSCGARREDRVADLPARRARKAVPRRATTLLVMLDAQGRVLLEQRPPQGIWGGLLALPELPEGVLPRQWQREHVGGRACAVSPRLCFEHAFTHFRLAITPLLCRIDGGRVRTPDNARWVPIATAPHEALPTPVRRILREIIDSNQVAK